jgi:two-component system, OmpR family, response regulator
LYTPGITTLVFFFTHISNLVEETEEKEKKTGHGNVFDLRLLVVDDTQDMTDAITLYCDTQKDLDCHVISNGQEALERIRKEKFDLILLDLSIPEFSGWDVVKSLKQDGVVESKNIVIFTASSDQPMLKDIRDIGLRELFKKPFSLKDLTELIEKYRPNS